MSRNITLASGEFYHVYNRGTDKRDIFMDIYDYERFLTLLRACNGTKPTDLKLQGRTLYDIREIDWGEPLVRICGYVLMPNHFHILLTPDTGVRMTQFMRKLGTAYTMYFNTKNKRVGSLFQGKFRAKHIDDDTYLQYILSYIHLNPVKLIEPKWKEIGINDHSRASHYLKNYKYSSYLDYCGNERFEKTILSMNAYPTELETPNDFEKTLHYWLQGPTL